MGRLRGWLMPPPEGDSEVPDAGARETLRAVRWGEIIVGVALIALGFAYWSEGWLLRALIVLGLLSLLPWPGAQAILRRAERQPGVLVTDPEQRRLRALTFLPVSVAVAFAAGYLLDGWGAGVYLGAAVGAGAGVVTWLELRRTKR